MEKYFKCNSCHQLIEEIFESECCGKLFCSNCIGILVNKPCPLCSNKKMIFGKNHFAQRLLKSIKVTCKFGCGKKFLYEEMRYHLLICENKEYFCSFDNCIFKGKKKEILNHLIKEHQIYMLSLMEYYNSFNNIINKISKGKNKKSSSDEKEDETLVDFVSSEILDEFPLVRFEQYFDNSHDDDLIINQPIINFNNRFNNVRRNINDNDRGNNNRNGNNNYENAFLDDLPFFGFNNNNIHHHNNNEHYNRYDDSLLDVTRSDYG